MATPQALGTNRSVRCPVCGSERVSVRAQREPIDPLYQTPSRMVQRLLGAQLYHCYVCRLQFYDNGEVCRGKRGAE